MMNQKVPAEVLYKRCLCVDYCGYLRCLSVCPRDYAYSSYELTDEFFGWVRSGPRNNPLDDVLRSGYMNF